MPEIISAKTAYEWLRNQDAILIDVREADEFMQEHIPYAQSVPLSTLDVTLGVLPVPKDKKIIFQCLSGKRSTKACGLVSTVWQGHTLYTLDGGISAWKNENLPIISKIKAVALPIMRQVQITAGLLILFMVALGFAGLTLGFVLAGMIGFGLMMAGLTGWCGMAMLLEKMPWNKQA